MMKRTSLSRILPAIPIVAVAAVGCFSDRAAITEPAIDADAARRACEASAPPPGVVVIRDFAFVPAQLRVAAGTRVTWVNCDSEAHTSTSDATAWNSGLLATRAAFTHDFDRAGSHAYHCDPHPFMKGTVVVE